MPIGNLLSQYFANLYLGVLDHELKDVLKVPGYVRYMDDFIIFADSKDELKEIKKQIEEFATGILKLNLNPALCNRTIHGIPFLSYKISSGGLRLSQKAKTRFRNKIKIANQMQSAEHALPLIAFIDRADSVGFRKKLFYGT